MFKDGEQKLKLILENEPYKAGIDPLNTFIDKSSKDNELSL